MISIENNLLQVQISPHGAELQSIFRKDHQLEYLWSGDPAFWGKKSPVLFPIVGGLKQNTYTHDGVPYQLGRHGFARDMTFEIIAQTQNTATFHLSDTPETLQKYPFPFSLTIRYTLQDASLAVSYEVQNLGDRMMYFSIGAHPAFRVPLVPAQTSFDDYVLHFSEPETAPIWPLDASGLIQVSPAPFFGAPTQDLPLKKSMFHKDALVFKHLRSTVISIQSERTPHGIHVHAAGFPYMGIWSAKDADFICIEPWCGIADSTDTSGKIEEKEGMIALAPEQLFQQQWSAVFF